jgi:hypothetical protein
MGKTINIRPTTGVYATYKNIKYDAWTAIAEFVDNSTQSYYDHENELRSLDNWSSLNIYISYKKDEHGYPYLEIKDNAYGMNFKDFQRAIVLDSRPEKPTRSEFGMGLKTAACWFGLNWSVETVELNSGKKYKTTVDVERLSRTRDEEITYEEEDCEKSEHGTTVRIWNLNRKLFGRQIQNTKDKLRGMYRVDLGSEKIKIFYNGENGLELLKFDPPKVFTEKLPDGTEKVWKKSVSFEVKSDDDKTYHVNGFIGILDKGSTYGAGLTLIRRGRVIVGGYEDCYRPREVFSSSNTGVYQRLFGELNLDDWPVTQTKDSFDWYNGLENKLIDELVKVSEDFKRKASENKNPPKKPLNVGIDENTISDFANAGIIRKPSITPIMCENDKVGYPVQIRFPKTSGTISLFPEVEEIPVVGSNNTQISFEISGRKYLLNYSIKKEDPEKKWLVVSRRENNVNASEFDVDWNIAHPFFKPYFENQDVFDAMKKFVFALVLSEIEAIYTSSDNKIEPWDIREKMNETLKTVIRK